VSTRPHAARDYERMEKVTKCNTKSFFPVNYKPVLQADLSRYGCPTSFSTSNGILSIGRS